MNILYFTHYAGVGGANKSMVDMCIQVRHEGINPYVVIPTSGQIENVLKENNIEYSIFPYLNWICDKNRNCDTFLHKMKMLRRSLINKTLLPLIAQFARERKIDIIHTNDSLTVEGYLLSKHMKLPHVWHIREFLDDDYKLKYAYSDKYVFRCYNDSDAVISISKTIMMKYINMIQAIRLVYNGIYLPDIGYKKRENAYLNIVFAGGGAESKGIDDVLGAMRLLHNKNLTIHFTIMGNMLDEDKNAISREFDLSYCDCVGFTSNVSEVYSKSDIVLVASKKEAFGRVTIEGMLHSCAVIASDTGANVELIEDGITGLLYKCGDASSLANKIEKLYYDRNLLTSIAFHSFQHAKQNYTMQAAAKHYIEIYKDVVSKRNK